MNNAIWPRGAAVFEFSARHLFATLIVLLLLTTIFACASGAVEIPLSVFPQVVFAAPLSVSDNAHAEFSLWRSVVFDLRLPRIIFAIICGGALALAGAVMQALFRNPLAEPGLIGMSSGAALGAVIAIVLGAQGFFSVAPAAFVGSLAATAFAYSLGHRHNGVSSMLLAGIALNAICGALIGLFTSLANDAQLRSLTFWNLGSLAGANWHHLAFLGPWTLLMSMLLLRDWRALNALLLGEREAQHLGFPLAALRRRLILLTALMVGPLVAAAGTILFVGLVVPHLVRLAFGADHRWLLPNATLGGALALTLADWVARIAVIPAEIPIGVVTGLIGGPFFLWLLMRRGAR
ncbi:MAG: iron ABC transporter permease [Spongiibacteraceae bacterium]